jgi:putative two-component system response regulator
MENNRDGKVLIIDDSKLNSKYLIGTLEDYGYQSLHAFNGLEALEILDERFKEIKAITLDRNMPVMDGLEFAKRIKSIEEYRDIPIIFISSISERENVIEGLKIGVYDYLAKPVDADLLYLKIRNAIEFYNQKRTLRKYNERIQERNKELEKLVEERTQKLQSITNSILNILENASSYNDSDTGNHIQRVAAYSEFFGRKSRFR